MNFNRSRGGRVAKQRGDFAERLISTRCSIENILAIQIPSGMRVTKINGNLVPIPVRTPFDFVFYKGSISACADIKFTDETNFTYSSIKDHQVESLLKVEQQGVQAGYIVFFDKHDEVRFYTASQLNSLKPKDSLKPENGTLLGTVFKFSLSKLFEVRV